MGTRHLTVVVQDGETKIAQYGQWDGYVSGAGFNILEFLTKPENVSNLQEKLKNVRFLDEQGKDREFIESYYKNAPEWSSDPDNRTPQQKAWFENYASRNIGSDILKVVADSNVGEILLVDKSDFAGDSLFCEWAYVIDFDSGSLEVYEGFNKEEITGSRFNSADFNRDNEYHPVKLRKKYELSDLPSKESMGASFGEEE